MVRNWDIIRTILLRLEASETANTALTLQNISEFPEQEVAYNILLLSESGYIAAHVRESSTGDGRIVSAIARRLTSSGHELLDTIRSETIWGKVKDTFKKKGIDMTFELVIAIGKRIASELLL